MDERYFEIEISIVSTLYCSTAFLPEFYQRMTAAVQQLTDNYELIFVDDGSPDESGALAKELVARDPKVKLVELSRNFGHHPAALAGLRTAKGRLIFLIDVDLEDSPEWLLPFHERLQENQVDVVYGVQEERAGTVGRRVSGGLFYRLFNKMSEVKIPANICTVRLMTADYVTALGTLTDNNLFLAGNYAWTGFRQEAFFVTKERMRTVSSYTLTKKVSLLINAITSFTAYPLQLIFTLGILISALAGVMGTAMLVRKLLYPDYILIGYASIMVSLWFLGGLIILFVGIVGLYLAKVFAETKGRPQYLIRKIYQRGDSHE